MNCCDIEAVSALIDGELPLDAAARIRAHLDECPSCRALFNDFTALREGFGELEADPPDTLAPGIIYKTGLGAEPSRVRRIAGRLVTVAACVTVLLIIARTAEAPRQYEAMQFGDRNSLVDMDNSAMMPVADEAALMPAPAGAGRADGEESGDAGWQMDSGVSTADTPLRGFEYGEFLERLEVRGLRYDVLEEGRRIWIGDEPYEAMEVVMDGVTRYLNIGEGIDIDDLIEKTRP